MPNFGYYLARAQGAALRRSYAALLPMLPPPPVREVALPFAACAYSGESAVPEQVASIRSFLRYAGRPTRFMVVSDGTHSQRSLDLLEGLDACIAVSQAGDWVPAGLPERLRNYLLHHPTGKQLGLIMTLAEQGPVLYLDSDVLFFHGARHLAAELLASTGPATYLADCRLSADERMLRKPEERTRPVNTGLLFLREKLDWSLAIERFLELDGEPTFFTNQTATHLAMHASGAVPLDPSKFVLQLDDQFIYPDRYAGSDLILRHYVNPVRHKFWNALWR